MTNNCACRPRLPRKNSNSTRPTHGNATTLDQTLAQIQKLKRDTQTPEEILKQLPQYLNLPEPITLNPSSTGDDSQAGAVSPTAVLGKIKKGTGQSETPSQPFPPSASAEASLSDQHDNPSKSSPASDTSVAFPDAANQSRAPASRNRTATGVSHNVPGSSPAQIPAADLKPLYDYVQDFRSCQAQLAAAQ